MILESPVRPVMEGSSVTLRCRKRKNTLSSIADFYKDGFQLKTGYKGEMTITNVSMSDEGLYKCNISGAGESPESRLAVKGETQHHWIVSEHVDAKCLTTPYRHRDS